MLFNSLYFTIFFPVIFIIYWFFTNNNIKLQNVLLLIASYFFYACWDWRFLFLLVFSTVLDYITGLKISNTDNQKIKKIWLLTSLLINIGFLGFFKYYNFFITSFSDLFNQMGLRINPYTLRIILPVGISFYTFHGLSYVIDIYRNRIKAEKNFIEYSVFVCFFPLLVAGPIERATHLLPQVKKKRIFSQAFFNEGILQIAIGFFRKIVIADTLAKYVDVIYSNPDLYNSSTLVLATIFYAFQIYFDFSGYSDIAIGVAKLLGFKLLKNFNLPYFSTSITEFWRKWHMSLSFWLRDYIYIELGGNRKGKFKTYKNLSLTMLIGGLWHGSNWTFIVWGGIHGLFLSIEKFINSQINFKLIKKINFIGYFYTFLVVCFSWIFFRSSDLTTAILIIKNIAKANFTIPFIGDINILINGFIVLLLGFTFDLYLYLKNQDLELLGSKLTFNQLIIFISIVIILITLFFSNSNNFIYFQF